MQQQQLDTWIGAQAGPLDAGSLAARLYASFATRHDAGRHDGASAARVQQDTAVARRADRRSPSGPIEEPAGTLVAARAGVARVLIPIDATERSRWAMRYAIAQHRADAPLEAHLLFVAEPITSLEVLRFRTQADIAKFQAERAHWLLEDAAAPLRQAGIATLTHFREGEAAFEILDTAEQLGCERIVLPRPLPRWRTLLGRDLVRDIARRARSVRVVTIGPNGEPAP